MAHSLCFALYPLLNCSQNNFSFTDRTKFRLECFTLQAHIHISGNSSIHCQFESITDSCLCIHLLWSTIATSLWALLFISILHAEYFPEIKQINELCRATRFAIQSDHTFFHCLHTHTHILKHKHIFALYMYACLLYA